MTTSIGTIAQQALRRLGVRVVPLDDSPDFTETVPLSEIASAAAVELGIVVAGAEGDWSLPGDTVTQSAIATSALVELGVLNSDDAFTAQPTIPVDDIAGAALIELGVIAADELPSDSDLLLATEKVVLVHDGLHVRGIAKWANTAIPASVAEEYIKLTAAMAASSFGKAVDPAIVAMLEGRIREAATVMTGDVAFMLDMVGRVHDSLAYQGIASWSAGAIPNAVAGDYTKLTAAYAAQSFGKQADPASIAALEAHARQAAMVLQASPEFMEEKVLSVQASLDAQGLVFWAKGGVPQAFAEEYIKLTVAAAATSLARQIDPAIIPAMEARVRKGVMVLSADGNAQQAVQAVHDDLVMRGVARWTVFDIPDPVGPQYAVLAADRLAPLFGGDTDPRDTALAMVSLYRFIALPTSGETVATAYF